MIFDLLIKNGTIVTSAGRKQADLLIKDKKIAKIGSSISDHNVTKTIDAQGLFILPGLIDAHVHFRDPGLTHKEDFTSGSRAALFGGITYVVDMPNVIPVTSTSKRLRERQQAAKERACMGMGFFALLTEDNLHEMEAMKDAGAIGYKIYLGTSVGDIAAPSDGVMLEQFRRAAQLDMRIGFHAENNSINDYFTQKLKGQGCSQADALVDARPDFSEVEAVSKAITFARDTGAKIHIYHVSSKKAVDLIREAKKSGIDITAETCPHYLLLKREDYHRLGTALKAFPTVKEESDRVALWAGLHDGTIDMIVTDHAPHTLEEKSGDIWSAMAGMSGVEISARLMLDTVNCGKMTLEDLVKWMSENPAKVWNLHGRGVIEVGAVANLTLVNMTHIDTIYSNRLHGKSNNIAFDGVTTVGAPIASVIDGTYHSVI